MAKFKPNPQYLAVNTYKVQGDRTPNDNVVNYDTLIEIAREWLKQNPNAKELTQRTPDQKEVKSPITGKTEQAKIHQIAEWIAKANNIKTMDGKDCNGSNLSYALIQPGWELRLPVGNEVKTPRQASSKKVECEDPNPQQKLDITTITETPRLDFTPAPPTTPTFTVEAPFEASAARRHFYPAQGNLSGGRISEIQDAANLPSLLARKNKLPDVAARGQTNETIGIHTAGDMLRSTLVVAPWLPVGGISAGNYTIKTMFPGLNMDTPQGANFVMQSRGGGNGTNQDSVKVGDTIRLDISPVTSHGVFAPTHRTYIDANLWKLVGTEHTADGRVVDVVNKKGADGKEIEVPGAEFNHNEFYNILGRGAAKPSITTKPGNTFLQNTPDGPRAVELDNYTMAGMVQQNFVIPETQRLTELVKTTPTKENIEKLVSVYNLHMNLTGMSNLAINNPLTLPMGPGVRAKVSIDAYSQLNAREKLAFERQGLLEFAASNGITGINPTAIASVTVDKNAVRAVSIAETEEIIRERTGAFKGMYKHVFKEEVSDKYDLDKPADVTAAATRFVEASRWFQTLPANADHLKKFYLAERKDFNRTERLQYFPQERPRNETAVAAAMAEFYMDPDIVRVIHEDAGKDAQLAGVIVTHDTQTIALSRAHGDRTFSVTRSGYVEAARKLGYREELMEQQFSDDETYGIIRNLPAAQEDIAKGVQDQAILAARTDRLRAMVSDGGKEGDATTKFSAQGAHARRLLNVLDAQAGHETLQKIERIIQAKYKNPGEAEARIELIKQGLDLSRDAVTVEMTGTGSFRDVARASTIESMRSSPQHAKQLDVPALGISQFVPVVATPDPAKRDTALAVAHVAGEQTRGNAINALHAKDSALVTAAIIETLRTSPALRAPLLDHLRSIGKDKAGFMERLLNRTPQNFLAYDLEQLCKAFDANDADGIALYTQKAEAYLNKRDGAMIAEYLTNKDANLAAMSDLLATTRARDTATQALAGTLRTAVTTVADNKPSGLLTGDATLVEAGKVIGQYDPANTQGRTDNATDTVTSRFTVGGKIVAAVPIPIKKATPDNPTTNPGTQPGCCTKVDPIPQPVSPVAPVTPPPTPQPAVIPQPGR